VKGKVDGLNFITKLFFSSVRVGFFFANQKGQSLLLKSVPLLVPSFVKWAQTLLLSVYE